MKTQKNAPIVFYILAFIVAVFFELYWIGNFPYDYFMLIGIGLVVLITGYLAFDTLVKEHQREQDERREQNETMIKAQKAIYLAAKKNSTESQQQQIANIKAISALMDHFAETITENRIEMKGGNAQPADMTSLIEELTNSNAMLAKEVQNAVTVNQLLKANEDLIKNVKDVLSGNMPDVKDVKPAAAKKKAETSPNPKAPEPSNSKSASETSDFFSIPAEPETSEFMSVPVEPETSEFFSISETSDTPETSEFMSVPVEPETSEFFSIPGLSETSKPASEPDVPISELLQEMTAVENSAPIPEEQTAEPLPESPDDVINIDDVTLEELDSIESDVAQAEAAVQDASDTAEAVNAASQMDSDPNAMLTPDEIAKLFANI